MRERDWGRKRRGGSVRGGAHLHGWALFWSWCCDIMGMGGGGTGVRGRDVSWRWEI